MKIRDFKQDLYETIKELQKVRDAKAEIVKGYNEAIKAKESEVAQLLTAIESGQMELGDDVGGGGDDE